MCNQEGPQPERPFSITMYYLLDVYLEQIKLSQQFDAKLARIASTLKVFLYLAERESLLWLCRLLVVVR